MLPQKNERVPNWKLQQLCKEYYMFDILQYIEEYGWPEEDIFYCNGCNVIPDTFKGVSLYPACFWHDLRYWLGMPGDTAYKAIADLSLKVDISSLGFPHLASLMYWAVSNFANHWYGRPFFHKWGRGRKNK